MARSSQVRVKTRTRTAKQQNNALCGTCLRLPISNTVYMTTGIHKSHTNDYSYKSRTTNLQDVEFNRFNGKIARDVHAKGKEMESTKTPGRIAYTKMKRKELTPKTFLNSSSKNKVAAASKLRSGVLCAREGAMAFYVNNLGWDPKRVVDMFTYEPTMMFITLTYAGRRKFYLDEVMTDVKTFLNAVRAGLPKEYRECACNAVATIEMHKDSSLHAHVVIVCPELAKHRAMVRDAWPHGWVEERFGRYAIHRTINYLRKDEIVYEDGVKEGVEDTLLVLGKSPKQIYVHPYVNNIKNMHTAKIRIPLTNASNLDIMNVLCTLGRCVYKDVEILQRNVQEKFKTLQFYTSDVKDYAPNAHHERFSWINRTATEQDTLRRQQIRDSWQKFKKRKEDMINTLAESLAQLTENVNDGIRYANTVLGSGLSYVPVMQFYTSLE